MILADNETCIDMINSRPIANSVAQVILQNKKDAVTIGIHGDWGAGKSSVLEMVQEELAVDGKVKCIKFNGWKHQGFEDAKIALMESIVTELERQPSLGEKAKTAAIAALKSLDLIKLAKGAGGVAASLATGIPFFDPEILGAIPESFGKKGDGEKASPAVNTSKLFLQFQESFDELIKEAEIEKLVVLIDDLDRCLPEVAIETLEAMRLFMFMPSTAFVIAADEVMIGYAVKKHFPDLEESSAGREFSSKYLEKLIQIPFKIPALGELEARVFTVLLLVCSVLGSEDEQVSVLINTSLEKLQKPWLGEGLKNEEIQSILGDRYGQAAEAIAIANQISQILSKGTAGNPRQIKRFVNTLLLRKQIAHARGFGEEISLAALAKLMLAERFFPSKYNDIAKQLSPEGVSGIIRVLEEGAFREVSPEGAEASSSENAEANDDVDWGYDEELLKWASIEPKLGELDLRPYYFISKERNDLFLTELASEKIRELVQKLSTSKMVAASATAQVAELSAQEAKTVFDLLCEKIQVRGTFEKTPPEIYGLRVIVQEHTVLQENLVDFLVTLPPSEIGIWIITGWESSVKQGEAKARLDQFVKDAGKTNTKISGALDGLSRRGRRS